MVDARLICRPMSSASRWIQVQMDFARTAIAARLYDAGLRRILIEGGACTVSRFIDAGAVDRLHLLVAPVILGSGKAGLDMAPIQHLKDALRPRYGYVSAGRRRGAVRLSPTKLTQIARSAIYPHDARIS